EQFFRIVQATQCARTDSDYFARSLNRHARTCSKLSAAAALAAGDLGRKRFELVRPEAAELIEPGVDLAQRRGFNRISPPRAVAAHAGEARLAQHFQVLRDRGLGDAELALDDGDDVSRAVLACGEQLQDTAPHRIAEDVEGVHQHASLSNGSTSSVRPRAG